MSAVRRQPPPDRASVADAQPFALLLPAALVALVAVLVFAGALANGFTGWDDTIYTFANPNAHDLRGLARIWTSFDNEQYYPLTFSVHWLEVQLFGERAAGYHAVGLLLHAANSALVLALLRALRFARTPAVLGALFFAAHPTAAMSVAWIAERKNLLACLFALSATLAWIRWRERGGSGRYLAVLGLFAAALLSKSQILGLPLAWLVLDRAWFGRPLARGVLAIVPALLLSAAISVVTRTFEQRYLDPHTLASLPPLLERVQIAAGALGWYAQQTVFPLELAPFHPLWKVSASSPAKWLPVVVLAAAATSFLLLRRTSRSPFLRDGRLAWALAHFALALAPILGLVAYANLPSTYVSDHYLYLALPAAAAVLALAIDAARSPRIERAAVAITLALLALDAALAVRYVAVFASSRSFWTRSLEHSPESFVAHLGFAESLAASGAIDEALPHFRRACEIEPSWIDGWQRLGAALVRAGRYTEAEPPLREALARSPGNVPALCDLGTVLEAQGRIPEALVALEAAVAGGPKDLNARLGLGKLYLGYARYADAEAQFAALVDEHPGYPRGWLGLATALRGEGRVEQAIAALRAGIARHPGDPALENMLALVLASTREDRLRDGAQAFAIARASCERTGYRDHQLLATLAVACAENGRFEEALSWSQKARELALEAGRGAEAQEEERRSELYRRREPYRR